MVSQSRKKSRSSKSPKLQASRAAPGGSAGNPSGTGMEPKIYKVAAIAARNLKNNNNNNVFWSVENGRCENSLFLHSFQLPGSFRTLIPLLSLDVFQPYAICCISDTAKTRVRKAELLIVMRNKLV